MKRKIGRIGLAGILAALLTTAPGCTTTSTGQKTVDPVVLQGIAQSAAAVGTALWLQQHPADAPKFELARTSLRALIATGSGSPADLQLALSQLPIKQLQGNQGAVIVSSAVVLLNTAGAEIAKIDQGQVFHLYVQPVAMGLLAGLDQVLPPPAAQ